MFVDTAVAKEMVEVFMTTPFECGRHETRVRKIAYNQETQASDHQPVLLELDI